ncbi:MAG: PAS domain S-box protein [Dehalococcoidia bacterium]|nr:MAG: PAS domain S-box protein [Dehalococcoidia bacterium]
MGKRTETRRNASGSGGKAGQVLRPAEEYFRSLIENYLDAVAVVDAGGNILYNSRTLEEILGYKREELSGRSAFDFVELDEITADLELFDGLKQTPGSIVSDEVRCRHRDGSWRIFEITGRNLLNDPVVGGIVASFHDITERKEAEKRERDYTYGLEFLSRTAMELVELSPEEDIYHFIGQRLRELTGDSVIFVSSFDEESSAFCVRVALGFEEHTDAVIEMLGASPVGLSLPIDNNARIGLSTNRLVKVDGGLYALASENILLSLCHKIERLLNTAGAYAIGFTWKGQLFGGASLLTREGAELRNPGIIEAFVKQASVALQRRQAEEALRESEERFRNVLDNSLDMVYRLNLVTGTYDYVSPSSTAVIGYTPDEMIDLGVDGMHLLAHPDDLKMLSENVILLVTRGVGERDALGAEYRFRHKELGYRWVHDIRSVVFDDRDTPVSIIGSLRDIEERKQAEEELAKYSRRLEELVEQRTLNLKDTVEILEREITERKKAEAKLEKLYKREKTMRRKLEMEMKKRMEFTRALAHELKTPLTPVMISSETLTRELKDEVSLKIARNISRGAVNLNNRINELLDLARGEVGMLQVKPAKIDALELLKEVIEDVSSIPASRGQSLKCKLPTSLPPVYCDKVRVQQIVTNLLNNAFKFTPDGEAITLSAGHDGGYLVVEINDRGPGITKREQKRLFNPYYRIDSDRERMSGLGLGLALCKNLVELHGGRIWVHSRLGQGSTFGFSLPLSGQLVTKEKTPSGTG